MRQSFRVCFQSWDLCKTPHCPPTVHSSNFQEEDGKIPPELLQKFEAEEIALRELQKERAASGIEDPRWDRRLPQKFHGFVFSLHRFWLNDSS